LKNTISHVPEVDQRRPTDRPYTNGYFDNLFQQTRRYAALITATRAKEEGEELATFPESGASVGKQQDETDDERTIQSMARRRKTKKPGDVYAKVSYSAS
jgi:hypothetical protein